MKLTNQYMLNTVDIGTVDVIENTSYSLCQERSDSFPSPEVTQSMSNLQANNRDVPMELK